MREHRPRRERRVMKQRDIRDEGPMGPPRTARDCDRAVRTCNLRFSFSSTLCVPAPPAPEGTLPGSLGTEIDGIQPRLDRSLFFDPNVKPDSSPCQRFEPA